MYEMQHKKACSQVWTLMARPKVYLGLALGRTWLRNHWTWNQASAAGSLSLCPTRMVVQQGKIWS
jgi:hypothetical protein